MVKVYVQEQRPQTVMIARTSAAADFIAATLAAHGIHASTMAYEWVYPSVEWVRGYRVGVPADEAERAHEVLDALSGRADMAKVDDAGAEGGDRP